MKGQGSGKNKKIYVFILPYPWSYILNVTLLNSSFVNIFSFPVHVFRILFWRICPLFEQILVTCLKCSRASFSPSSYSEKMRWGRGWWMTSIDFSLLRKINFISFRFCSSFPFQYTCLFINIIFMNTLFKWRSKDSPSTSLLRQLKYIYYPFWTTVRELS